MEAFKKVWNIVSTVLVVILVLCAVFLMGSRMLGYDCYTVLTGSMSPQYLPGDLVYVKQVYNKNIAGIADPVERDNARKEKITAVKALVDSGELAVGDVVTFMMNEKTVLTHRIVRIEADKGKIYTMGDTNDVEDEPVLYENLIGEVCFSLPKLGYVSNFIQNPPGTYIAIGVGVVLILLVFLPDMLTKKKTETDPEIAAAQADIDAANEENARLKAELERLRSEVEGNKAETAETDAAENEADGQSDAAENEADGQCEAAE